MSIHPNRRGHATGFSEYGFQVTPQRAYPAGAASIEQLSESFESRSDRLMTELTSPAAREAFLKLGITEIRRRRKK